MEEGVRLGEMRITNTLHSDLQETEIAKKSAESQKTANEKRTSELDGRENKINNEHKTKLMKIKEMERDIIAANMEELNQQKAKHAAEVSLIVEELNTREKRLSLESSQAKAIKSLYKRRCFIDVYEGNNALRKCGGVYIVSRSDGLIKIGETGAFSRRFKQIKSDSTSAGVPGMFPIMLVPIDEGRSFVEAKVHEELKEYKTSGEWFNVSREHAINTVIAKVWDQHACNAAARCFFMPFGKQRRTVISSGLIVSEGLECPSCDWTPEKCSVCGWLIGGGETPPENLCKHYGKYAAEFIYEAVEAVDSATAKINRNAYDVQSATQSWEREHNFNNLPDHVQYGTRFFACSAEIYILDESNDEFHKSIEWAKGNKDSEDYEIIGKGNPVVVILAVSSDGGERNFMIVCDDLNPCEAGYSVINFCCKASGDFGFGYYNDDSFGEFGHKLEEIAKATFATCYLLAR